MLRHWFLVFLFLLACSTVLGFDNELEHDDDDNQDLDNWSDLSNDFESTGSNGSSSSEKERDTVDDFIDEVFLGKNESNSTGSTVKPNLPEHKPENAGVNQIHDETSNTSDDAMPTGTTARPVTSQHKPERVEDDGVDEVYDEMVGLGSESNSTGSTVNPAPSQHKPEKQEDDGVDQVNDEMVGLGSESNSTGSTVKPVPSQHKPEKQEDDGVDEVYDEKVGLGSESNSTGSTVKPVPSQHKPEKQEDDRVDEVYDEMVGLGSESNSTGSTVKPVSSQHKPEKQKYDGVDHVYDEVLGTSTNKKPTGTTARLVQSKYELESCLCVPTTSCKCNGRRYNFVVCEVCGYVCCPDSLVLTPESRNIQIPKAKPKCGRRKHMANGVLHRIVGSNEKTAEEGEFPWMVAIFKKNYNPYYYGLKENYLCGGSLIHPHVVLTAARKVLSSLPGQLTVRAGDYDLANTFRMEIHQTFGVMQIITHPQFNPRTVHNDYGILILSSPAILTDNVGIICLPKSGVYLDYEKCVASGWGKYEFGPFGILQQVQKKANLPAVGYKKCEDQLSLVLRYRYIMHTSLFCTEGKAGIDIFSGDEGSPLVCPVVGDPETFVQAGIVAAGNCWGQANVPGLNVNVGAARKWIESVMTYKNLDFSEYQHLDN